MKISRLILKLSFVPLAMILLFSFIPESFSETELKTVEIFVQPPTGLTTENGIKDDEQKPTPQNSPNSPSEIPTAFVLSLIHI